MKNTISSLSLFIASLAVAIVCLLPSYSFGQKLHQGQWKTYTAMSGITDLAVERKSGNVWAATSGGAFRFSPSQNPKSNILALRNTDGLSDNDLTAVAADSSQLRYAPTLQLLRKNVHANLSVPKSVIDNRFVGAQTACPARFSE